MVWSLSFLLKYLSGRIEVNFWQVFGLVSLRGSGGKDEVESLLGGSGGGHLKGSLLISLVEVALKSKTWQCLGQGLIAESAFGTGLSVGLVIFSATYCAACWNSW